LYDVGSQLQLYDGKFVQRERGRIGSLYSSTLSGKSL